MSYIQNLFSWFAENEAGLSGVAALIVILGVLISVAAAMRTFLVARPEQRPAPNMPNAFSFLPSRPNASGSRP
ncbi:MAG: hypothetical protein V7761_13435, partial [Amylibacter sp.]